MGCLRVKKLNDYLCEPLKQALTDKDPYVRKTAAICVPKVSELTPKLITNTGMIELMQTMLEKETNMVVLSNIVISLLELSEIMKKNLLIISQNSLQRLLIATNEYIGI